MAHKVVSSTLSADVAAGGTFTISYPTGFDEGHFDNTHGHILVTGANDKYNSPGDFTLTFGTSNITVTTGSGMPTLPANTKVWVQLDLQGDDKGDVDDLRSIERVARAELLLVNLGAPDTADPNGYVESQDLTSAGVFSVDTTVAAALAAAALGGTADVPRNVVAAWTTTAVLTVTGTDEYGKTLVESSASGTSFTGKKAFKTVTNISASANITGLTVGTGDVLGLPVFLPAADNILDEFKDGIRVVADRRAEVRVPFQIDQTDLLAPTNISMPCPVDGVISALETMAWKAVTTGGAVTMKVNNTAVDGLSVTVADGGGAGDFYTDSPTAGHASTIVAKNDKLEIIPSAAFATAGALTGNVVISRSAAYQVDGTVVAGDQTDPTATTGDVRGTYDPTAVPDGATTFALLVALPDPAYKGLAQYAG